MRSQCALRGHLASGGALLGAVAHAPVREAEAVLAAATSEAIGRASAWGLKEGLLVSSGGLGRRGCWCGDPREAPLSRFRGRPAPPFPPPSGCEGRRAPARAPAGRANRQVPRRVNCGAP